MGAAADSVVELQGADEGFLRDVDAADRLHPLLAFLLLLEQLVLSRDVAAVELGGHILAIGLHRAAGDDLAANGSLDRYFEVLARDEFLELLGHLAAVLVGLVLVYDRTESVDRITV